MDGVSRRYRDPARSSTSAALVLVASFRWASAGDYTPGRPFEEASPEDARRVKVLVARAWRDGNVPGYQKDEIAILRKYGYVAVPGLLKSLRSIRSTRRCNAAYLLSIIDDPVTIPHILNNLPDRYSKVGQLAYWALRDMSDESTASFYLDALGEPCSPRCEEGRRWDRCVPGCAIHMLGRLRSAEAVPAIIPYLRGPHSQGARKAILGIGDAAAPALLAALSEPPRDPAVIGLLGELRVESAVEALITSAVEKDLLHKTAVLALGRVGNRKAVEALERLFEKPRRVVHDVWHQCARGYPSDSRVLVCRALGYAADPSAVGLLEKLFARHRSNSEIRSACIHALGQLAAGDVLARMLEEDDRKPAMEAAIALARMHDRRGVELLGQAFLDEKLYLEAVRAAAQLPDKALVPDLIDALRRAKIEVPAKRRLSGIPAVTVIRALYEITNRAFGSVDSSGRVNWRMTEDDRVEALRAYEAWWKQHKDRSREEWLVADLENPEEAIVRGAIKRLGESRCQGAVPALEKVLLSQDLHVRIYAMEALGRIGDISSLVAIRAVLKPRVNTGCVAWNMRATWRARLALGDKSVLPELIGTLHNYAYAAEAARLLRAASGLSFERLWDVPKVRERGAAKWEKWWHENGNDFVLRPVRWE